MADMISRRRYEFGENHHNAKLTKDKVSMIRFLCSMGVKQKFLANRFGVDPSSISNIIRGKNWVNP